MRNNPPNSNQKNKQPKRHQPKNPTTKLTTNEQPNNKNKQRTQPTGQNEKGEIKKILFFLQLRNNTISIKKIKNNQITEK